MPSATFKRKAYPEEVTNNFSWDISRSWENRALRAPQLIKQPFVQSSLLGSDDEYNGLTTLVRKELTNSDVANTGRIVLPKKEAEENLPSLDEKGKLMLNMEDLILPATWTFKYKFWPNNRSRMYVIENTGDFVRSYGLQPGDLVIIYKRDATGTFAIRGKKRIRETSSLDAIGEESEGSKYVDHNNIDQPVDNGNDDQPVQTGNRKRKCRTRTDGSQCMDQITDSSPISTEMDSIPTGSFNDDEKRPIEPSNSLTDSLTDFDLAMLEGILPH